MKDNQKEAWLFLAPATVCVAIFSTRPALRAFTMSFEGDPLIDLHSNGFSDYQYIFSDPEPWRAIMNIAIYSFLAIPVALTISAALTWFIFSKIKHTAFLKIMFSMPYVTSTIATGIVFRYISNGEYGLLNFLLELVYLPQPDRLDNPSLSPASLIIFGVWSPLAFNIVILVGALENIEPNYYILVDMYGATSKEKFWRIIAPQLVLTLAFPLTVNLIGVFKIYTQVYVLLNGRAGVGNSAMTTVYYIYNKFQTIGAPGVAMATTVVLSSFTLLVTFLQRKLMKKVNG